MKQAADKLASEINRMPSLKLYLLFLEEALESKMLLSILLRPGPKVFCLGDYLVKKEPQSMESWANWNDYSLDSLLPLN